MTIYVLWDELFIPTDFAYWHQKGRKFGSIFYVCYFWILIFAFSLVSYIFSKSLIKGSWDTSLLSLIYLYYRMTNEPIVFLVEREPLPIDCSEWRVIFYLIIHYYFSCVCLRLPYSPKRYTIMISAGVNKAWLCKMLVSNLAAVSCKTLL